MPICRGPHGTCREGLTGMKNTIWLVLFALVAVLTVTTAGNYQEESLAAGAATKAR